MFAGLETNQNSQIDTHTYVDILLLQHKLYILMAQIFIFDFVQLQGQQFTCPIIVDLVQGLLVKIDLGPIS